MNTRITSLSAALSLVLASGAFAQNTPPTIRPFDVMPNQWRVGLAGNDGTPIWGDALANMVTPIAQNGTKIAFAFGQCYGGGMLTNLSTINAGPNGVAINISATSASSWHQTAWYPAPINGVSVRPGLTGANTPNDHSYDWVDSYVDHFGGNVTASAAADLAWTFDPFGTNVGPVNAAGRVDRGPVERVRAREIAQYFNVGTGGTLTHNVQTNKQAILYSGKPNAADADQMSQAWASLRADGYAAANIHVLFGAGWDPLNPNAIVNMLPLAARNQAIEATENNLANTIANIGAIANLDQLFFLSNDHGTARNNAWPANRWVETPKPGDGPSSGSQLPYDLEGYTPGTDPTLYFGSYYVPSPGALSLGGLGLLMITRRRR
ncbi:MAG: hypothetical protein WC718_14975 [Phycisphaerales bacterium]|jgi:hypothetical protein